VDIHVTEMFRLLRNVFEKLAHIVKSPLILTSDGRFSQSVQLRWWCYSRGRFRVIFHIATQEFNARNDSYYELMNIATASLCDRLLESGDNSDKQRSKAVLLT
jgi:hypothetical protein